MKIEDLFVLSLKDIYTPSVISIDNVLYDKANMGSLNGVILVVGEESIDVHKIGMKITKKEVGKMLYSFDFNDIKSISLALHRGADAGIRSDRPLAYYIFESRIVLGLNDGRCLKFKSQSIPGLKLLSQKIDNNKCEVIVNAEHLSLIDLDLSYTEQYDKLVENASIFNAK